jgi:Ran GTPase-activating protein (RanGAP) involved in mRNA processing and transport
MLTSSIPLELLYEIIGEVMAQYIDRAITTPPPAELRRIERRRRQHLRFEASFLTMLESISPGSNVDSECELDGEQSDDEDEDEPVEETDDEVRAWEEHEGQDPLPRNPISPLLLISRGFHEITLKVLFEALGTSRDETGR